MLDHFQYDELVGQGFNANPDELDDMIAILLEEAPDKSEPLESHNEFLTQLAKLCFMAGRSFQAEIQEPAPEQTHVTLTIPANTAGRLLELLLDGD